MTAAKKPRFGVPQAADSSIFKKPDAKELQKIDSVIGTVVEQGRAAKPENLEPAQDFRPMIHNVGEVKEIPVGLIKLNPYNARQVVSTTTLEQLAVSIGIRQDTSVLAYIDDEGHVCLIDGHRRVRAARIAGKETVRVEIREKPATDQELYLQSRRANTERDDQTPLDDAFAWKLLLDKGVYKSQIELATALGIDETVFSRVYSLSNIPQHIIRLLSDRPHLMTLRMLNSIRQYCEACGEQATEELLIEIDKSDLSSRQVDAKRAAMQAGPKSRARGMNVPLKFQNGNAVMKRFDEKGKLVVEISSVVDPVKLELLTKRLNETMTEVLGDQFQ